MAKLHFIILDEAHQQKVEEGDANINGATLIFKRGGILGILGGEEQSLEFDRRKLVPSKKSSLIAYYELDATGNITQLSFNDIQDVSVSSEFIEHYEKGKAIEESGIKPPHDWRDNIKWLAVIVAVILIIVGSYEGSQLGAYRNSFIKATNVSNKEAYASSAFAANVCTLAIKIANSTLGYVNRSNAALKIGVNP